MKKFILLALAIAIQAEEYKVEYSITQISNNAHYSKGMFVIQENMIASMKKENAPIGTKLLNMKMEVLIEDNNSTTSTAH